MKNIYLITAILMALAFLGASAHAQRRPVRRPTPRPAISVTTAEIRDAKTKVSNQAFNVTKFTGILSSVASGIEATDRESRTKRLDRKVLDANAANKQKLVTAIKSLRTALTDLEAEFKSKVSLRRFVPRIDGIAALSIRSEELAFAGKFTESKAPLDSVAQKLRDTMALMP